VDLGLGGGGRRRHRRRDPAHGQDRGLAVPRSPAAALDLHLDDANTNADAQRDRGRRGPTVGSRPVAGGGLRKVEFYPPVPAPPFDPSSPPTSFPQPSPTTSDLTGWRVLLRADDQFGTSAGLVSADGTHYVVCHQVHDASSDHKEELREMEPPQNGPVPTWWTDPAQAHLVDQPLGWSQICQKRPTGKVCPDELYYGVGPAYEGVTRVHIEWPDKTSGDYPVTNGYYVARHMEKRVERLVDPKVRDMQNFPPIYISFYDATGKLLIRYNHNPSMPIPATCPTDHGC
jgi:hypothetical protein